MNQPHKPVGAIFDAALDLPPERRTACVHEAATRESKPAATKNVLSGSGIIA